MRELIPPHKRTVELTFEIFKNKKITRNELTNMKLISTMKLRLKYNKIAYLCRKHNRQGADRIIRESTYGVRIIGDSPSGMDSASSMEDALFFLLH